MLTTEQMNDLQVDQTFDPAVLGGSIKRKIVNPLLLEERAKCNFDRNEAFCAYYSKEVRDEF